MNALRFIFNSYADIFFVKTAILDEIIRVYKDKEMVYNDIVLTMISETLPLKLSSVAVRPTAGENFRDPTHNKSLPGSMMKFIAEARGLCRVEILNLPPYPETFGQSVSDLVGRFNEYFYGPQYYAVMGDRI